MSYFIVFFVGLVLGVTLSGVILVISFYLDQKNSDNSPVVILRKLETKTRDKSRSKRERPVIIKAPSDEVEAMEEIVERNKAEGRDTKLEELA